MTKGYVKAVINKYDIERLKESVKVGDRLIYRTIFRDILFQSTPSLRKAT